jgi:hypothetical protein
MTPSSGMGAESYTRDSSADLWRNTLSQIPSVFGRLVYLSGLRDPNTGAYLHHGFAALFGEEEAGKALRHSHEATFATWLAFTLPEQKQDLELYVAGLEPERHKVAEAWSRLEPYRTLPPESARPMERELFLADLEALISLIRNEPGASFPDRDA